MMVLILADSIQEGSMQEDLVTQQRVALAKRRFWRGPRRIYVNLNPAIIISWLASGMSQRACAKKLGMTPQNFNQTVYPYFRRIVEEKREKKRQKIVRDARSKIEQRLRRMWRSLPHIREIRELAEQNGSTVDCIVQYEKGKPCRVRNTYILLNGVACRLHVIRVPFVPTSTSKARYGCTWIKRSSAKKDRWHLFFVRFNEMQRARIFKISSRMLGKLYKTEDPEERASIYIRITAHAGHPGPAPRIDYRKREIWNRS